MFFNSLRWRLQLWHGLILCLVLTGFGLTAYRLQHANELRRVDQELQRRLGPLLETLRRPQPGSPGGERRGPPPRNGNDEPPPPLREFRLNPNRAALFEGETNAFYYVIQTRTGRELSRSASAPGEIPTPPLAPRAAPLARTRQRGEWRELYEFTPPGECLLVGRSIAPELAGLRELAFWLTGLGGTVLLLGLAGGWWLATRAIRPIDDISAAAAKIAGGDLSHRIDTADTHNELGRLAAVLNSTFARLDAAFTQQARFTADASHELRTPVSVILTQTQMALSRERSAADYRETLEACQRAAQRMRRLIESLLELARLDAGQEPLQRASFDLGRTAQDCIELVRPLAVDRHIPLHCELPAVPCFGDSERLAQVVTNLLTNAIVHNQPGGEVRVSAHLENGFALLTVADTGPGIPAEELPRLFERFHRTDQSRTGATGGTGLGLAISKAIIDAHGGTLTVESQPGAGTSFTFRLPAGA